MKNITKMKDWIEYPLILNASDVQEILTTSSGVAPSLNSVRDFMNADGFPLIKGFKELKVSRDALKNYLLGGMGNEKTKKDF